MKHLRQTLLALPLLAAAGNANAVSYTGNYLVTFTHAHPNSGAGANGSQYCFALTDTGTVLNWRHSGVFVVDGAVTGQFFVAGRTLVASFSYEGDYITVTGVATGGVLQATAWSAITTTDGQLVGSGEISTGKRGSC